MYVIVTYSEFLGKVYLKTDERFDSRKKAISVLYERGWYSSKIVDEKLLEDKKVLYHYVRLRLNKVFI